MYTVEEALKLECPDWYRQPFITTYCKADKCMAWRWVELSTNGKQSTIEGYNEPQGYCGKAGKP